MDFLIIAITLGATGKILLGVAVMMVHWRIVKEHKIDRHVLTEMRRERNVALVGILLIFTAYLLEASFYGYIPTPALFEPFVLSMPL